MTPDQELVLVFGGLHLVALLLACGLFWMFLRSDTVKPWEPDDDDESGGGGGNDRLQQPPKPPRPGGIPLPDAEPSPQRFRGPGRLADRYEWPVRRSPERTPQRTPDRV